MYCKSNASMRSRAKGKSIVSCSILGILGCCKCMGWQHRFSACLDVNIYTLPSHHLRPLSCHLWFRPDSNHTTSKPCPVKSSWLRAHLTNNQLALFWKIILRHLQIQRCRTPPHASRYIVVTTVARTEPPAIITCFADGYAA